MNRRHTFALAASLAAVAVPAGVAGAQEPTPTPEPAPEQRCSLKPVKRALDASLAGNVLTVTPAPGAAQRLIVKSTKRGRVVVTRTDASDGTLELDVPGVEGETFEVVRLKAKKGRLQLRIRATAGEGEAARTLRFEVIVRAANQVCRTVEADDESGKDGTGEDEQRGRGRGPETDEEREQRKARGEGRGPETAAEREDRVKGDRPDRDEDAS